MMKKQRECGFWRGILPHILVEYWRLLCIRWSMITFLFTFITFFKKHCKLIPVTYGTRLIISLFPDHYLRPENVASTIEVLHYGTASQQLGYRELTFQMQLRSLAKAGPTAFMYKLPILNWIRISSPLNSSSSKKMRHTRCFMVLFSHVKAISRCDS